MPLRPPPNEDQIRPALALVGARVERPPIELVDPAVVLGSGPFAQIRLRSEAISKAHALLLVQQGKGFLRDLASRTQLFLNGQQVAREALLKHGDVIRIGNCSFAYLENSAVRLHLHAAPPPPIVLCLERSGELRQFRGRTVLIGRRQGCDLLVENDSTSGAHAAVFCLGNKWYLRDLGSRTGTFVNGVQHTERGHIELRAQDVIRVGPEEVRFLATVTATSVYRRALARTAAEESQGGGPPATQTPRFSSNEHGKESDSPAFPLRMRVETGQLPAEGVEKGAVDAIKVAGEDINGDFASGVASGAVDPAIPNPQRLDLGFVAVSEISANAPSKPFDRNAGAAQQTALGSQNGDQIAMQDIRSKMAVDPSNSEFEQRAEVSASARKNNAENSIAVVNDPSDGKAGGDDTEMTCEVAFENDALSPTMPEVQVGMTVLHAPPVSLDGGAGTDEVAEAASKAPLQKDEQVGALVRVWSFDELSKRMQERPAASEDPPLPISPRRGRGRMLLTLAVLIFMLGAIIAGFVAFGRP